MFIDLGADISIVRFNLVNDDQYLPGTVKVMDISEGQADCKLLCLGSCGSLIHYHGSKLKD